MAMLWRRYILRNLKPSLVPLLATRLVGFTTTGIVRLLVIKAEVELDRVGGSSNASTLLFLPSAMYLG